MKTSRFVLHGLLGLLGLLAFAPTRLAANLAPQIEEEDLDQAGVTQPVAPQIAPLDMPRLYAIFGEAEALFRSADQPAALPLIAQIVDPLEAHAVGLASLGKILDAPARQLLAQALAYRAQIQFNIGDSAETAAALSRLLEVDADYELDPNLVSPKLLDQFLALARQKVGQLSLTLDPVDAKVTLDGQEIDVLGGPVGVLAGPHVLRAERPGHEPHERPLTIEAGKAINIDLALPRKSPILRLHSRPRGAEVLLDGVVVGQTSGVAAEGTLPLADPARREEFSSELILDPVAPGFHVLELKSPGYRTYRAELTLDELIDYPVPPIVLEPESGKVVFIDFPAGAKIVIDGKPSQPDVPGASRPVVTLAPGDHQVMVTQGSTKMFATRFQLADRQTVEINVRLRPGLAFLGVLGNDRVGADAVLNTVRRALSAEGGRFAVIEPATPFTPPGLTLELLRAADGAGSQDVAIDWAGVQKASEAATPGLLYALAVLSNDLVADEATLWIWAASPGPARPDRLKLKVGDATEIERLRAAFDRPVELKRPYLGALAVDSSAAPHPVLIDVTPESPAARAGLTPGDLILGVAGAPIQSRHELEARWRAAEPGETLDVAVSSQAGARTVKVPVEASPYLQVDPPADFLPTVAYAQWILLEEKLPPADLWLAQANMALILLRSGDIENGVRRLRSAKAPQASHGVSQATLDYFLGLALLRLGDSYADAARAALERAAQVPGARLEHHDGAFLQSRARTRLFELQVGQ